MIALSVSEVSLSFGMETVLKNISFSVNDGDRVGVIGVNGAGKTSLFKVITGEYTADSGAVYFQKGYTVGCLEQNPDLTALPGGTMALEYMYSAFPALLSMESKISALESEISALSASGMHDEAVSRTSLLTELNRKFALEGGLEFKNRCKSMLLRLGFEEELLYRNISTLSGGQYTRLALARLLATEPDILMLDEPTNHLDIDALAWLESFLASYKKTVIIISHDRYFLDRTTNKTLHIQYAGARLYNGNYTETKELQEAEAASLEKRYKEQQKEIAKIKANIEFQRRCNREHNFVTIRSKEKQLARMEKVELAPPPPKDIRLSFNAEEESAGDVLSVKELSFSYSGEPLINNISFLIRRYERVLFLGKNGCGKSTLMKLINSMLTPNRGKLTLGYNIKIGYYDQENRGLDLTKTVFEEIHDEYPEKKDGELRSALALFLFGPDDIIKPISVLSGGERARLTLAKLMLKKVNLLIMDEPTNHLDIGSAEALENALLAFDGTIIAVSHDRYFINRIATRIIELDRESERGLVDYSLEDYDDAYTEYIRIRSAEKEAKLAAEASAPKAESSSKLDYEQRKRENAERRANERKLTLAKEKIEKLEGELTSLDDELYGSAATNYVRAAEIEERKAEIEEELLALYELVM
ncbi:MAG: ABC-F family ATP-binding cassette domain-containing protein [Clostridia bacterium]|nr:ABC-F family ATP-binding cassette domain-containing protein [Clostridia bacterium]